MPSPLIIRKAGTRIMRVPALTSISVWLKADGLQLAHNDLVSTFTDFSGLGRNFTASGTNRPTFKTVQKNGLPGVFFDGTDDEMTGTLDAATAYSVFMVLKMGAIGGTPCQFRFGDTNNSMLFLLSGANRCIQHRNAGATATLADGAANTTTWELWSVTCASSGSNPAFKLSTVTQVLSPTNGAYGAFPATGVLGSFNGSLRSQMTLGELLVYKAAVSAADRLQTETYLMQKWGL